MDKKTVAKIGSSQLNTLAGAATSVLILLAFGIFLPHTGVSHAAPGKKAPASESSQEIDRSGPVTSSTPSKALNDPGPKETVSVYTDVSFDECQRTKTDFVGDVPYSLYAECEGVSGYKLELVEVDARQTVNIIYPDEQKKELRLNRVVSPSFSYTGEKAEWRVAGEGENARPVALILRYIFTYNPAISSDKVSYLTVSKITDEGACVTAIVKPKEGQNEEARRLADSAYDAPCLGPNSAYADEETENKGKEYDHRK